MMMSRQLWSQVLAAQMERRGITPRALAQAAQIGKTTLERWCDPDDVTVPRAETVRDLVRVALQRIPLDDEGLVARLWDDEAEVIDWMHLLGWCGRDTLRALKGDHAEEFAREHGWWRPLRGIPQVTSMYFPRDLEPELQRAVLLAQGFRQPRYAVMVVRGERSAEACDVVAHVIHTATEWREHFRDGMYWLEAQGLGAREATRALVEMLKLELPPSATPHHVWLSWAAVAERNALIVLNEPTTETVSALVRGVGSQIQFIVITSQELGLGCLVGHDRVRVFHLTGYSANEVVRLAETRGLALGTETQRALDYVRECLRGEPAAMRLVLDVLAREKTLAPAVVVPHLIAAGHLPAPAPAPHADEWIERPEVLAQIRAQLITAQAPLVVLHGPPGSGKSTLVAQLMHDPALQLHFRDGIFRIPHTAGDQDRDTLTDKQIESIAARVRAPLDPTLPREEAVQQTLSGRRCLVILEDWQHPASVRWLRQCIAPPTAILVTTRSSSEVVSGLGLSRESIITLPPFSLAETEQFYRRLWAQYGESVSETDRQRLPELHHLTRGNPLGLQLSLLRVRTQGWDDVLQYLHAPEIAPRDVANELFQPLQMAYQALPSETREFFARLGALPELMWYDAVCFRALWHSTLRDLSRPFAWHEHLHRLEHDAGLVQSHLEDGERVWTIHAQVLAYARLHYAQRDERERREAAEWYKRAVKLSAQKESYARFFQGVRLSWKTFLEMQRYEPSRPPLWRRLPQILFRPRYVPDWEYIQTHSRYFTAREYVCGFQLCGDEIKRNGLFIGYVGCVFIAILLYGPPEHTPLWLSASIYGSALGVFYFIGRIVFRNFPRWEVLWRRSYRRMAGAENPRAPTTERPPDVQ